MKTAIKSLTFYPNGHVSAYNIDGEQFEEINAKGWLELYFDFLMERGYDVASIPLIEARMNDGRFHKLKPFLKEDGSWAYGIEPTEPKESHGQ